MCSLKAMGCDERRRMGSDDICEWTMQPLVKPLLAEEITVHTVRYQNLVSGILESLSPCR